MHATPPAAGIFIALGANLGDRAATLRAALAQLAAHPRVRVLRVSSLHETEPVGGPSDQPRYLNAAAELATDLPPDELLTLLGEIEAANGRQRTIANGPRTLDLDLLLYRDQRINTPFLSVPHPRMWSRRFVLEPLSEICDLPALRRRFDAPPCAARNPR